MSIELAKRLQLGLQQSERQLKLYHDAQMQLDWLIENKVAVTKEAAAKTTPTRAAKLAPGHKTTHGRSS